MSASFELPQGWADELIEVDRNELDDGSTEIVFESPAARVLCVRVYVANDVDETPIPDA